MIRASFMNDRVGPMCRSVKDVARILEVIAGYDPDDELTAFSMAASRKNPMRILRTSAASRVFASAWCASS